MIKELKSLNINDLSKLLNQTFNIVEKIDAPYFSVVVTNSDLKILKSNGLELTQKNMLLNSMYYDILKFVKKNIFPISKKLRNTKTGFFYFPSETPRTISYPEKTGTFMLSDTNADESLFDFITKIPILSEITITDNIINDINDYLNNNKSEVEIANKLTGKDTSKMEGIIFKSNIYKQFQILITNTALSSIDSTQKKIYRDIIIKDIISWFNTSNPPIIGSTYIEKVENIFIKYINNTEILNKYDINEKDIMPPYIGYFGDISYGLMTNNICKLICQNNGVMKGIFRIMIATLDSDIKKTIYDILDDDDIIKWKNIRIKIKEGF